MTPEQRTELVSKLRGMVMHLASAAWEADALREAADELEAMGRCGYCGREVYASLKPMCGDCAGTEGSATATLRADLAKAKADLADKEAGYRSVITDLVAARKRVRELEQELDDRTGP